MLPNERILPERQDPMTIIYMLCAAIALVAIGVAFNVIGERITK